MRRVRVFLRDIDKLKIGAGFDDELDENPHSCKNRKVRRPILPNPFKLQLLLKYPSREQHSRAVFASLARQKPGCAV